MRGYVVRTELTLAGRGIKLNGMQGGIGKSLFTVHLDDSIFEIEISLFCLYIKFGLSKKHTKFEKKNLPLKFDTTE